jgi:hypothetical protein
VAIEIMRFRTIPGTVSEAVREADAAVQVDFAYQQPGLLRRTTARSADGEWVVVSVWRTSADAEAAERRFAADPTTERLRALIDQGSLSVSRYDELS